MRKLTFDCCECGCKGTLGPKIGETQAWFISTSEGYSLYKGHYWDRLVGHFATIELVEDEMLKLGKAEVERLQTLLDQARSVVESVV
jgi:hypothetical protein